MNWHMLSFLISVVVFGALLAGVLTYSLRRSRQLSRSSWANLLAQLAYVNREGIERVARDLVDIDGELRTDSAVRTLDPGEIWRLVGGIEGLENLEQNSLVLIQMAYYVRRWHPDASASVEELRSKAREIAYIVRQLRAAERAGKLEGWFANYAQNAVASYSSMTECVLSMFQDAPPSMLSDIQRSI